MNYEVQPRLFNRFQNKDTAFTREERDQLNLRGLLPHKVETIEQQSARCEHQYFQLQTKMERYIYLNYLQNQNETLFYHLALRNVAEMLPVIYTPTVGDACLHYGDLWRSPKGMYFTRADKGQMRRMLDNWPTPIDIVVVTDGSRILGLGDVGANGMGIPVGKLSLYVCGAGFNPARTLPVTIDCGTNGSKIEVLNDNPRYLGYPGGRIPLEEQFELFYEFVEAAADKWPNAVIQYEDFDNTKAFILLEKTREQYRVFNDDIQGTGVVCLGAFLGAMRMLNANLLEQRFVFLGAGAAGVGVADIIAEAIATKTGISKIEARKQFWLLDSRGLVCKGAARIAQGPHKEIFAREDEHEDLSLLQVIEKVKPTCLIGLSCTASAFTEEVVKTTHKYCSRPLIMALSNPTRLAECTAEQAYGWTNGQAIFATGSPFADVTIEGRTLETAQCNNMYVFPGIGHGAWLSRTSKIPDSMMIAAADALASCTPDSQFEKGNVLPDIANIREVSARVAASVMEVAFREGLAEVPRPEGDLVDYCRNAQWVPAY
eukprot:gnl/Trimastix_PCT/328.p2 GENE.gnl/Trimastix_PCT/328~~gnl/Trimastix_PCT/328.p2  ORF type:complete len:563 (-),score=188.03 gnl/Trimastix_PCT/328:133-1764(-)